MAYRLGYGTPTVADAIASRSPAASDALCPVVGDDEREGSNSAYCPIKSNRQHAHLLGTTLTGPVPALERVAGIFLLIGGLPVSGAMPDRTTVF